MNNFIALIITLGLALIWLRLNDFIAHRGWVSSTTSRKIIHIGTGPIYVLCWLLFDQSYTARFYAAVVPLLITLQFLLVEPVSSKTRQLSMPFHVRAIEKKY